MLRAYDVLATPEIFAGSPIASPRAALAVLVLFPLLFVGFIAFFLVPQGWGQLAMFTAECLLFLLFLALAISVPKEQVSLLASYLLGKQDLWALKEPIKQAPSNPTTSPVSGGPQEPPSP
jgi:hypothetical protein